MENISISRRILLVEDNADVREMLQTLLELAGHLVQTAEDGLAGLEVASRTRPDAVVIDLGLPRLDGGELARRLRALLGRRVRLIALTGYSRPEGEARRLESAFDAYLVKPVMLAELARAMDGPTEPPVGRGRRRASGG